MKVRIIERSHGSGKKWFVIQTKFLNLIWIDGRCTLSGGSQKNPMFITSDDAMKNIYRFDGSKPVDKEIFRK